MALVLSALTYIAAAMALEGFVPERLHFLRTFQAQLAASFATLISPPTLGAVAVNCGICRGPACTRPWEQQASASLKSWRSSSTSCSCWASGVIAGTRQENEFTPPSWAILRY